MREVSGVGCQVLGMKRFAPVDVRTEPLTVEKSATAIAGFLLHNERVETKGA